MKENNIKMVLLLSVMDLSVLRDSEQNDTQENSFSYALTSWPNVELPPQTISKSNCIKG